MKLYLIAGLIVVLAGGYLIWASLGAHWPYDFNATPTPTSTPAPATSYRNAQYGLAVKLPTTWRGFTTINDSYTIYNISTGAQEGTGVVIKIRHPQWTSATPREDLPIMVFTPANWNRVLAEAISVGAAPIPPSELARNSQYVFALPARYNYDFKTGWEEVQAIIDARSITAFEPMTNTSSWETYSNTRLGFEVKIPPSWKGYRAREEEGFVVWFEFPTKDAYSSNGWGKWLAITRRTIAGWQAYLKEDGPKATFLAQNDLYVYAYGTAQDYGTDMEAVVNDYRKVLATFKITQ